MIDCGNINIAANITFISSESKAEFMSVVQDFCRKLTQEMSNDFDKRTSNDPNLELLCTTINGHGTILQGNVVFNVRENNESLSLTSKDTFLSAIESFCRELEQEMDGHYDERKEACLEQ